MLDLVKRIIFIRLFKFNFFRTQKGKLKQQQCKSAHLYHARFVPLFGALISDGL